MPKTQAENSVPKDVRVSGVILTTQRIFFLFCIFLLRLIIDNVIIDKSCSFNRSKNYIITIIAIITIYKIYLIPLKKIGVEKKIFYSLYRIF